MSRLESLTQTLKQLSQLALPTNGWIRPGGSSAVGPANSDIVMLQTVQRDFVRMKKNKALKTFSRSSDSAPNSSFTAFGWPQVVAPNVAFIQPSPSWKKLAIVRGADKKEEEKDKYSIEIWDSGQLLTSIPTDGKHAQIYADVWFGSLVWSADEKYLAYIAEKNADKVAGFFDLEKKDDVSPGNKFKLQEDWGETYKGGNPAIFACSLDDGVVCSVDGVPDTISAGQVQFSPSGEDLIFVGWNNEPRRLGIVHCYNRPSALYSIPFDRSVFAKSKETKDKKKDEGEEKKSDEAAEKKQDRTKRLTNAHRSSRSPRFSPDGQILVYLASDNATTHNSASKLCSMDWQSKVEKVVVDIPTEDYDMNDSGDKFPGLFTNFLSNSCFLSKSVVALETMWRSRQTLATIDLTSGTVSKVKIPSNLGGDGSIILLDVRVQEQDALGAVLLDASAPNKPNTVLLGRHNAGQFEWTSLPQSEQYEEVAAKLNSELGWSVGHIPTAEYIHIFPSNMPAASASSIPVIVFPHGGPHGTTPVSFTISASYFAKMGYAVLFVNYRGSLGFGKKFVDSLLGHVGDYDIEDCINALKAVLAKNPQLDSQKIFVYGGSHGGWIGAHLATRGEEVNVKATSLVNPVTNIAHNYGISDIPDWCVYEAGLDSLGAGNTVQGYQKMFECSPVGRITAKTSPSLLILGSADKRVPPSNGIDFYYQLKNVGVDTKLLRYPGGGHGLVDLEHESDLLINTLLWFDQHGGH